MTTYTRPVRSAQLDGLAELLTKLAAVIAPDGPGRTSLAVMASHADAVGYPSATMGGGPSSTCSCEDDCPHGTSTERYALTPDVTVEDYRQQVADITMLLGLTRRILDRHSRYSRRNLNVCPRCSLDVPASRVRCVKCGYHPDTRVCANASCPDPVLADKDPGRDGYCEACWWFRRRHKRDRTADDARTPRRMRAEGA